MTPHPLQDASPPELEYEDLKRRLNRLRKKSVCPVLCVGNEPTNDVRFGNEVVQGRDPRPVARLHTNINYLTQSLGYETLHVENGEIHVVKKSASRGESLSREILLIHNRGI